jgi:phosphate-selective porin OprO/OprP
MRATPHRIRAVVAVGAVLIAALAVRANAADPAPTPAHHLTDEEYDRKIQQLEDAIKELRKDTRQLQVAGEEDAKLKPIAGWDKGFFIQSPDGNNKLTAGGYVHFDGRYYTNDQNNTNNSAADNQFLIRRARLDLRGKFLKYYEFRFMPDFAGGQVVIQDAYLNFNYVPWARVQAGKYKTPFGIERLQSANAIVFVERALPNNLVPNRDLGVMLWGQPFYGALEYELGVFDGVADGGSNNNDLGLTDDKTFAGRLFVQPLKDWVYEWGRGFSFGVAGTFGDRKGSVSGSPGTLLPSYKTDGQQTFFQYVSAGSGQNPTNTAVANGPQWRISPQGTYYWGPFGLMWEWVQSNNAIKFNRDTNNITANAWQIQTSWVVTGEENTYKQITPARNFDPWTFFDGAWGALQVAARGADLSVEKDVYNLKLADRNRSARAATAWGLGANWFLNPMVRIMLDFDRSTFTGGAPNKGNRKAEDVIESRLQFVF